MSLMRPVIGLRSAVVARPFAQSVRTVRTICQTAPSRQSTSFQLPCKSYGNIRSSNSSLQLLRASRTRIRSQGVRWNSSRPSPDPTPNLGSPTKPLTLSQRLKALSKEYGWSAVGVYLGLSALDFPFCFLAVRWLGAERVGQWEHAIAEKIRSVIPLPEFLQKKEQPIGHDVGADAPELAALAGNGSETASIWTQLVLAYAVHKSLIVFRVPLTAAVLPKVVKTLRSWGYNVGRATSK